MKKILLITLVGLTTAINSLCATQTLSITGPTDWTPGTSITLSVTDSYSGFGIGSFGLSYWLEVSSALAPFLTITGVTYFNPFTDANYAPAPTFPVGFTDTSGADAGFLTTREPTGQMRTVDLGATSYPFVPVPDGTYHITDITFFLAAGAPFGFYQLRTTTASPRSSVQVTSDFGEAPFPQAVFFIPEPSTLALLGVAAIGTGIVAYRRRK